MKKLLSMFLACVLLLGILPTSAWAADSVEAALGEVDIYNGGYELGYHHAGHLPAGTGGDGTANQQAKDSAEKRKNRTGQVFRQVCAQ